MVFTNWDYQFLFLGVEGQNFLSGVSPLRVLRDLHILHFGVFRCLK